jgi:hypothetical protein
MRRKKQDTKRLERTAYHEAGHAVAFYHFRIPFFSVDIIPKLGGSGHILHPVLKKFNPKNPKWNSSPKSIDRAVKTMERSERLAIAYLAGKAAEERFAKKGNRKWPRKDLNETLSIIERLIGQPKNKDEILWEYFYCLWMRAKALFDLPELWAAVEAVAKELFVRKEMDRWLILQIIRKAIDDYEGRKALRE